jgi:pimeloyl-ACP methyl ester carboxylesterase
MPSIAISGPDSSHEVLLIMLPGRGDRASTFITNGFQEASERYGFDMIAADAHFGYFRERNLVERLHADIVLPAIKAGYKKIWLLGISAGGFGSILYASQYPDQIDGVILLAPFLGEREAIDELVAGGGLATWSADESKLRDYEIAIWSWFNKVTSEPNKKPLILGYGKSDHLAGTYGVLLEAMDSSSVYTREGGHKWATWKPLWDDISADLEF